MKNFCYFIYGWPLKKFLPREEGGKALETILSGIPDISLVAPNPIHSSATKVTCPAKTPAHLICRDWPDLGQIYSGAI